MNWLTGIMVLLGAQEHLSNQSHDPQSVKKPSDTTAPQPNLELLLFLAEWEEPSGEQWLDPEIFTIESEFNHQLDQLKAQSNEDNPDNH